MIGIPNSLSLECWTHTHIRLSSWNILLSTYNYPENDLSDNLFLPFSYNLINFLVNRFQNYVVIENVVKLKQIYPHWYLSKSCHNKINIVRIFGFHIMNWWKILIRIYSQQIRSNHNSIFQCLCLYVNILYMNVERFYQRMMMNEHFLPVECGKKKIIHPHSKAPSNSRKNVSILYQCGKNVHSSLC